MLELDAPDAPVWLADRLGVPLRDLRLTPLGGGVSNLVYLAEAPGLRCVVKQALARLRVEQDWFASRERVHRECAAMRALTAILPPGAVPAILFEDQEHHLFAMQAAQPDAKPWKSLLLDGEIVPETARRIGQLHGIWLRAGATKPGWCEEFGDLAVFEDLRVDPYYRSTAARHPDLEPCFALLVRECLKPGISLVHGDLSPKNILVTGGELVLIDFEVVHWGDPAFDMAFLINHFLLKAFYRPRWAPDLIRLAFVYRDALFQAAGTEYSWVESAAMRHLGGLLLARIDGKSPAEYIQDRPLKETIRAAARGLLLEPAATVEAAMGRCFT